MDPVAGLDDFLTSVRGEGVPVGVEEVVRLQRALRLAPRLDAGGFLDLLQCTLAKKAGEREAVARLYGEWTAQSVEPRVVERRRPEPARARGPARRASRPPRRWRPRWPSRWPAPRRVAIGTGVAVIVVALAWLIVPADSPTDDARQDRSWLEALRTGVASLGGADPLVRFNLLITLVAWTVTYGLWRKHRRSSRLPEPDPSLRVGPDWLPLLPYETRRPLLLGADDVRTLVWGIGRFVSEEPTTRVDLDGTVRATARAAGVPQVRFQPEVHPREVWLWQDALAPDPAIERLASEVHASLVAAGLPMRRGAFASYPGLLRWDSGEELTPQVAEGHRQTAIVAVLTDGRGLRNAEESEHYRRGLHALLESLASWPRLAFVDFGRGEHGLAERLRPYGLAAIAPEGLFAFLGAGEARGVPRRLEPTPLVGDLRAWAAAACVAGEPLDPPTALALREALGLALPPWAYAQLAETAAEVGGLLRWTPDERCELVNWLAHAERATSAGIVHRASHLGRALAFWQARYRDEARERAGRENALARWSGSPAEKRLKTKLALLDLWEDPDAAVRSLYRLSRGAIGAELRERLGSCASLDWDVTDRTARRRAVFLPWRLADRPDDVRVMLGELGFGAALGTRYVERLRLSPGLVLALGIGLGVGLAALLVEVVEQLGDGF